MNRKATAAAALLLGAVMSLPAPLAAQRAAADTAPQHGRRYWLEWGAGAATSLLAHEAGHVITAYAVGAHPWFGFDTGRPTIYSGINSLTQPHKQFLFSSMGLNVQAAIDELVLDVPHAKGSAFERGILASGIGTALFYVTIGRTGSVSDIDFMARTSSLTKTDLSLIYGGVAAMHAFRVHADRRYADFFARPNPRGGLDVGLNLDAR